MVADAREKFTHENSAPIIVFGGNGFVGSAICEVAARQGLPCISISRRGAVPKHLQQKNEEWLERVQWLQSDAMCPDVSLLQSASAIINTVGSPPVPTLTQAAFDHQLNMNGEAQTAVIEAAITAGVNRVVVMGADIPRCLQTEKFAYYLGKQQALAAAKQFAESSELRQAAVLQPAAIYGTRFTAGGHPIPLSLIMSPASRLLQAFPTSVQQYLPAAFVDVKKVALAAVSLATADHVVGGLGDDKPTGENGFSVVSNHQLQCLAI